MATATEIKAEVDTLVLKRLKGGAINRYSLADGRSIQRDSVDDILKIRQEYAVEAEIEADGSSVVIIRWSDDPGMPS